ncbi:putative quinol monooxygenase [Planotetraspora sp. GP83]|uniref:putative quinol monooxygenase n=1 Tax=Planotetraspora sp. GP83 TaxID=3156264 RepID=UPI00351503FD
MVQVGLFVRIEAKPGHEAEVEAQLKAALAEVEEEPDTTVWLALRLGPSTFAVVDAFPDETGRQAHLEAGRARLAQEPGHFAQPPTIEYTDVIAAKLPSPSDG